jgi:pantothenate kinase-related protein Tda10
VTDWQRRDAVSEFKNFNYYLLTFKSINFDKIFRRFCSFFRSLISPAEMDPIENVKPKRPFTIVVEGNIGSGKSTFLNQVIIYNYFLSKSKMRY